MNQGGAHPLLEAEDALGELLHETLQFVGLPEQLAALEEGDIHTTA